MPLCGTSRLAYRNPNASQASNLPRIENDKVVFIAGCALHVNMVANSGLWCNLRYVLIQPLDKIEAPDLAWPAKVKQNASFRRLLDGRSPQQLELDCVIGRVVGIVEGHCQAGALNCNVGCFVALEFFCTLGPMDALRRD